MKFWDASAIVPLLAAEAGSAARDALLAKDPVMVVWWATHVECRSALVRKQDKAKGGEEDFHRATARLDRLARCWTEVGPLEIVRSAAERCLRLHRLRTADAFQLAAALVACRFEPGHLPFVCSDSRLAEAASREGFPVIR
jgi:predicted nucleic acid-binding protein